jgi:hypothetical protein
MLALIINNVKIPLTETSVRFEYVNSLFNDSFIQGDYTFPFNVAETEVVLKALKFASALDAVGKTYEFESILLFNNQMFLKGNLYINGYTNRIFSVNMAFGIKGNNFIDKPLTEYDFGGIITPPSLIDYANETVSSTNWKDYPLCFPPHYNADFYGDSNEDWLGVVNKMDVVSKEYYSNSSGSEYNLVPWFYVMFLLNHVAETEGYTLTGDFVENPEASKLILYNNYALDELETFYSIFITKSNNQPLLSPDGQINFLESTPEDVDKDNCWLNNDSYKIKTTGVHNIDIRLNFNSGYINIASWPALVYYRIYVLINNVVVHTFWRNINNFSQPSGYEKEEFLFFSFNATAGQVNQYVTFKYSMDTPAADGYFTPPIIRPESYIYVYVDGLVGVNVYAKSIDPRNHIPKDTVGEFLNNLKNAFGLFVDINPIKKIISINFHKNTLLKKPIVDYSKKAIKNFTLTIDNEEKGYVFGYAIPDDDKLCENNFKKFHDNNYLGFVYKLSDLGAVSAPGSIKYVRATNKYYIVSDTSGSFQWEIFSDRCDEFTYGNSSTEIKSKYMPMFMNYGYVFDSSIASDVAVLMPHVKQTGSSPAFSIGVNDFTPRMMFNHGLRFINNDPDKNYLFSSSTNYDPSGVRIANFSLMPGDEDGTHENFTRIWLEILMGKEVIESDFIFDFLDIMNFNANEPIFMFNQIYLVKTGTSTMSSIIEPIKLYLVKYNG